MTGSDLRATRKRLGLKQRGLASLLGIHWSTVARYEQGAIDIPPAVALLVDVLDVVPGVRGRLEIIAGVPR